MVKKPNRGTEALRSVTLFGHAGKLVWVICNDYQLAGSFYMSNKTTKTRKKSIHSYRYWWRWWEADSEEVQKQIQLYDELKPGQTYRSSAAFLILLSSLVTLVFSLFRMDFF